MASGIPSDSGSSNRQVSRPAHSSFHRHATNAKTSSSHPVHLHLGWGTIVPHCVQRILWGRDESGKPAGKQEANGRKARKPRLRKRGLPTYRCLGVIPFLFLADD